MLREEPIVAVEMGRGSRRNARQGTTVARGVSQQLRPLQEALERHSFFVRTWRNRMDRALAANPKSTLQEQMLVRVRALRDLTYNANEQRRMIKAAQDAGKVLAELEGREDAEANRLRHEAESLRAAAREMFVLCNFGALTKAVRAQASQLDSEHGGDAIEMLRQEGFIEAMTKAIDRYDFSRPVKPLTYAQNWIRAAISRAAEEGRLVRLKSKAHRLGQRVEQQIKRVQDSEGREPTVEELAKALGTSEEKIREVLPFAEGRFVRLDKAASTDEGDGDTIGNFIVDADQQIEESVIDATMAGQVLQAVDELESPLHRRMLQMLYGLRGHEQVQQRTMFDGVYRDAKGNAYSAEQAIVKDRAARGEKVTKVSQRELNRRFAAGELTFEPGTPEAHELARIAAGNYDPRAGFEKLITRETGIPLTSGTVQDALDQAHKALRRSPRLRGLAIRYRGDNELENSRQARRQVLAHLCAKGVIDPKQAEELDRVRTPSGAKSKLRLLAEEHGLVDPNSGRINLTALTASSPQPIGGAVSAD